MSIALLVVWNEGRHRHLPLVVAGRETLRPVLSQDQVDRLWAAWQEANLATDDEERKVHHGNPGFPDAWLGPLFNFSEVDASELFDYKALGYEYDSLPQE